MAVANHRKSRSKAVSNTKYTLSDSRNDQSPDCDDLSPGLSFSSRPFNSDIPVPTQTDNKIDRPTFRISVSDSFDPDHFHSVYLCRSQAVPVLIHPHPTPADLLTSSRFLPVVYVSKSLHACTAIADVWDVPPWILVKFQALEAHAPVRQAFRLTLNLFTRILDVCAQAEQSYLSGTLSKYDYQTMRDRFLEMERMFLTCPRWIEFSE